MTDIDAALMLLPILTTTKLSNVMKLSSVIMACRPRVFVTRSIPENALKRLELKCDVDQWSEDSSNPFIPPAELAKGVEKAEGLFCLITDTVGEDVLKAGPNLKVIATMSVGYDHIDVDACRKRNILLGNTPDVLTEATAELTVALLLCTSRRLIEANADVHSGGWGTWSPLYMCGQSIDGSTVGLLGFGRIGLSIAEKLVPFKPKEILYHCRARKSYDTVVNARHVSSDELFSSCDFLIVCCALTEETRSTVNTDAFSKMKPNCILVNTSRGPVVDQEALYEALSTGRIRSAGLDVSYPEPMPTDHKLLKLKNFVMLPHIGSATEKARNAMAELTVDNILAGLEGRPLPAPIP